jgi:hypothetical protein
MNKKLFGTTLFAGILFFIACDSAKKSAADAAINVAQGAYNAVADQANQYVPDQARDVQTSIQAAKEAFNKGDYSGAFDVARNLPEKIKALNAAISAKKADLTSKWNDLSAKFPGLVEAVQTRVDALQKHHKLPAGAADNFASAKQSWGEASSAFQSGKLQDAFTKASAAKEKLMQVEATLGMKPAA